MGILLRPVEPEPPAGPRRVRVDVTADDIAGGDMCNGRSCPVARAITRVVGVPAFVANHGYWSPLAAILGGAYTPQDMHQLPRDVWDRVNAYDRTGYMEPFSFEVDA